MTNRELLQFIRNAIQTLIKQGTSIVQLSTLDIWLSQLESQTPDSASPEEYKAKVQADLAVFTHQASQQIELLRSAMSNANETLKACLLVNGGAAVALLAFMGHLATQRLFIALGQFAPSMMWFIGGLAVGIVGHGLAYRTNLLFYRAVLKRRCGGAGRLLRQHFYR